MNIFAELYISSKNGTEYLFEKIKEFCNLKNKWEYDEDRSNKYSKFLLDSKGCCLIYKSNKWSPGFAFCEKKEGNIYLANIVPKEQGQIPIPEYNSFAKKFYDDFKKWIIKREYEIKMNITKTDLEIEDIISAKIPRKHFKTFLNAEPFSRHPNDIKRLDQFICSVARYSRKPINWDYLSKYLKEKEKWEESYISFYIDRIQAGLDIIQIYRGY